MITRYLPPDMAAPLLEAARSDFQRTFDLQASRLDEVPRPHPLGELLQGLGEIYSRQNKPEDAAKYYTLILERLPDSEYSSRASEWLATRQPLPLERTQCVGCHIGGGGR